MYFTIITQFLYRLSYISCTLGTCIREILYTFKSAQILSLYPVNVFFLNLTLVLDIPEELSTVSFYVFFVSYDCVLELNRSHKRQCYRGLRHGHQNIQHIPTLPIFHRRYIVEELSKKKRYIRVTFNMEKHNPTTSYQNLSIF